MITEQTCRPDGDDNQKPSDFARLLSEVIGATFNNARRIWPMPACALNVLGVFRRPRARLYGHFHVLLLYGSRQHAVKQPSERR